MTEPVQYEFYRPWPLFGQKLSNQWGESRQNSEVLAALVQAAGLDLDDVLGNSDLMSWELGQHNFHNRFRFVYDDSGTALRIQKNAGTEGVPIWVDALVIDYETLAVNVPGAFSSGFYIGLNRVALFGLHQIQPSEFYNVTDLYFSSDDGFYFTTGPNGSPVVRLSDRVTGGGGGAGISSITVRSTVSSPTYATDTIIFDKDDFYLSPSSTGKPIVSLNAEAVASLSSITVKTTVPLPTFSTGTVIFDRSDFYISPNSAGLPIVSLAAEDVDTNTTSLTVLTTAPSPTFATDTLIFDRSNFYISPSSTGKPIVSWTPSSSSSGSGDTTVVSGVQSQAFPSSVEWIFNHNLNSRPLLWSTYSTNFEAVLPDKMDISDPNTAYFYFVEAFAGTAIVSSGRTSVDLTGGFYGMSIRNNPRTESFKNINLLSFDATDFYLTQNAPNRDEVLISLKENISQKYVNKAGDTMTGSLNIGNFTTTHQIRMGTFTGFLSTNSAQPPYSFATDFFQGKFAGMAYYETFFNLIPNVVIIAGGTDIATFTNNPIFIQNSPYITFSGSLGRPTGLFNAKYYHMLPMTTADRDTASFLTPTNGMLIYNSTTATIQAYISGAWVNL